LTFLFRPFDYILIAVLSLLNRPHPRKMAAAAASPQPRERKPSVGAPISTFTGPVGPGFSRPKHKRTPTGFGAGDIKAVESSIPEHMREA
jgi:hypothetical protein